MINTVKQYCEAELDQMVAGYAFPGYSDLVEMREVVDDCLAGQRTIKERGKYLPPTKWQKEHPESYHEFLYRALFPNETKYSLDIYEGLFNIGDPKITLPEDNRMDYLIKDASVYRDGLKQIQVRLNKEQMTHGLRMLLLEVRKNDKKPFYIQEYGANKFLRAHFNTNIIPGESIVDCVLLNESTLVDDIHNWQYRKEIKLRILGLDANMRYYQRQITPQELKGIDIYNPPQDERTVYPAYQNRYFDRIPVVWCGANSNSGIDIAPPPLLTMAQTELKLFLCMAHNSQHIYMNTQESIVITGASQSFKLKDNQFVAGAVVVIPGDNARAQYLSTNGIGFDAEEKEIARLKNSIEEKRLSLMNAKSHQSGTVVGLVQNSQSAPLRTIIGVAGNSITHILKYAAGWMGYNDEQIDKIEYVPSDEFANPRVNLSEFISLCKAVISGDVKMLEEDLFDMAKKSNFINSSLTWQNFKQKYELEWDERQKKMGSVATQTGNPFANMADNTQEQNSTNHNGGNNNEVGRDEKENR